MKQFQQWKITMALIPVYIGPQHTVTIDALLLGWICSFQKESLISNRFLVPMITILVKVFIPSVSVAELIINFVKGTWTWVAECLDFCILPPVAFAKFKFSCSCGICFVSIFINCSCLDNSLVTPPALNQNCCNVKSSWRSQRSPGLHWTLSSASPQNRPHLHNHQIPPPQSRPPRTRLK